MIFKFTGKSLFIVAGIVCLISVVLSPLAFIFFYMAVNAQIAIEGGNLVYKMLFKKSIAFQDITRIYVKKTLQNRYYLPQAYFYLNLNRIVPMVIEYGNGKKIKFSLNYFQNSENLTPLLEQKTGKKIEWPND